MKLLRKCCNIFASNLSFKSFSPSHQNKESCFTLYKDNANSKMFFNCKVRKHLIISGYGWPHCTFETRGRNWRSFCGWLCRPRLCPEVGSNTSRSEKMNLVWLHVIKHCQRQLNSTTVKEYNIQIAFWSKLIKIEWLHIVMSRATLFW